MSKPPRTRPEFEARDAADELQSRVVTGNALGGRVQPRRDPDIDRDKLRFSPQQRAALAAQFFEPWTQQAACATKNGIPGQLWQPMFLDDVAAKPDPDAYEWPRRLESAMRVCAECPVRRECLEASFRETGHFRRQFGVRGGVPGRIREMLGFRDCRNCRGKGYVASLNLDGTVIRFKAYEWVYQQPEDLDDEPRERAKGFTCATCEGTGRVEAKNRLEACQAWFEALSRRRRWTVSESKEGAA